MSRIPLRAALIYLALTAAVTVSAAGSEPPDEPPIDSAVTERVRVVLRQVDFLVLDRRDRPVTDLRRDEVRLWDEGEEREVVDLVPAHERRDAVQFFEGRLPEPEAPGKEPAPEKRPEEPPAQPDPKPEPRWIVFFVDANNISYQSRIRALQAVRNLVEHEIRPEDRVALMVDEDELRILVPLTTRRAELIQYLDNPEGFTSRSRDLQRRLTDVRETAQVCREAGYFQEMADCAKQAVQMYLLETTRETERSLDHLEVLLRSLAAIPDRKILFYVSEGIVLNPGDVAQAAVEHAIGQFGFDLAEMRGFLYRDYRHRLDDIYQLASESRTGIYPVNTLRKMSDEAFAPEHRMDGGPENPAQARADAFESTWSQVTQQHRDLARVTGGLPLFNRDPQGMLWKQLRASQGVYSVSFYPSSFTSGRRKLRIKVSRKGARVLYMNKYRPVPRRQSRMDGELVVEVAPEDGPGAVRARVKVAGASFALAPGSDSPTSSVALFFEVRDDRNLPRQSHYEVISFPRGEKRHIVRGVLERPFALRVPPGSYVLRVDFHDVHGPGWGSFTRRFTVDPSVADLGPDPSPAAIGGGGVP